MKSISQEVLDVLSEAECEGSNVRLAGTIDRKLYVATDKVLKALGGKWNTKVKAHIFNDDAAGLIGDVVSNGCYLDKKQELGFFETPKVIVDRLFDYELEVGPFTRILEPSAGRGRICQGAIDRGATPAFIDVHEIDPAHHPTLDALGVNRLPENDFLRLHQKTSYDLVVMNSPFAKSADIKHVTHAWEFLKPGGTLTAIMSVGWTFREDFAAQTFRRWLESVNGTDEPLDRGAFKESGTMVATTIVRARKPRSPGRVLEDALNRGGGNWRVK